MVGQVEGDVLNPGLEEAVDRIGRLGGAEVGHLALRGEYGAVIQRSLAGLAPRNRERQREGQLAVLFSGVAEGQHQGGCRVTDLAQGEDMVPLAQDQRARRHPRRRQQAQAQFGRVESIVDRDGDGRFVGSAVERHTVPVPRIPEGEHQRRRRNAVGGPSTTDDRGKHFAARRAIGARTATRLRGGGVDSGRRGRLGAGRSRRLTTARSHHEEGTQHHPAGSSMTSWISGSPHNSSFGRRTLSGAARFPDRSPRMPDRSDSRTSPDS